MFLLVLALLGIIFLGLEAFRVTTPWFSFGWLGATIWGVVIAFALGIVSGG